ncbi:mannosyl-N-acetyl-alpha-D-glucosaminyl-diphospho-ditrans,octacis-undecaprenol 3-alpha-mannosyltransferase / alpha-1,3-rhamnosyltransferase [Anaerolineales bacterium]|nr:mannosyl-N-acetyl-alpha-D-glucosaminyl-diphospho-ditrans,octacis-undecaprenol 3-alpha-mannosyltransferase / alpha-1,3-rhamnosyltransferase [Anaerolineales bacterium]
MSSPPPNLFVYDSIVFPANQRGVNRYFLKFVDALVQTYTNRVLVYSQQNLDIPKSSQIRPLLRLKYLNTFWEIKQRVQKFDLLVAEQMANMCARVFYSPYFGSIRTKIPEAYTLPDMIYEKFPQYFPRTDVSVQNFIAQKRACFDRAALILPISRSTAKDLLEYYPHLSPERIKVVYLGVDDLFFKPYLANKPIKPYFLFVGNRSLYKNFLRFIDAFGKSGLKKNFDLKIISPTPVEFSADENEIIRKHGLAECIKAEFAISDNELKKYYAEAYAFVYPTEYEGFGLPVIEALASGTLVLTSNTSSLPEVGGSSPLYFDPCSVDAIVNALHFASQMSDSERRERVAVGKTWATQFTWENSQKAFVRAIQELLDEI